MALSNIFREPRREITESAVGTIPVLAFLFVDYHATQWLLRIAPGGPPWPFTMILVGLVLAAIGLLLFLVFFLIPHWIGEGICDAMARRGIELRPKQRYR